MLYFQLNRRWETAALEVCQLDEESEKINQENEWKKQ